jgi:hypothetical protein
MEEIVASYDFRIRFDLSPMHRINADIERIELVNSPSGECIRLRSNITGTPIKDHNRASIIGGSYPTEIVARQAADKSKRALLYWAIEQHAGIDFGDGKQRSVVTNQGLAFYEKQIGFPCRNDNQGIDIFEHIENLRFVSFNAAITVGISPPNLITTFQREYQNNRLLTPKQELASEIYTGSFFDTSARSRFITLVTAIEALLEPSKRSIEIQTLVDGFETATKRTIKNVGDKGSILGSLNWLRYQSIGQAGRELANRLLPNELFEGLSSQDFFTRCYDLRSSLLHTGTVADKLVDTAQFANGMETFVNHLLLATLNEGLGTSEAKSI